mgnify:CR=1 FL=1
MTDSSDRLVLVAGELHDLSGPGPEWPGGQGTLFHQPGAPLPARTDVDAIIPLVSQRVGEAELAGLPSLRVVANYGVGYDNGSGAQNLLLTVVPNTTRTVYTRVTFYIADVTQLQNLFLGVDFDDGYAAWINGVEVYRSPEMPPGAPAWDTL